MPKSIAETLKEMHLNGQDINEFSETEDFANLIDQVNEAADKTKKGKQVPYDDDEEEDSTNEGTDTDNDDEEDDDEPDEDDLGEAVKDVFDASGKGNQDTTGKGNEGQSDTEDGVKSSKTGKKAKKKFNDGGKTKIPSVGTGSQSKDIAESLNRLFKGKNLSEDFTSKAILIFESAVNERVAGCESDIKESYESLLENAIEDITEDMSNRISKYLAYVTETWAVDNKIALEHGIKNKISENFMNGLRDLLADHYIDIPEEKYDVLEDMNVKIKTLEKTLSEQIDRNIEMQQNLNLSSEDLIFQKVAEGLTDIEIERFHTLVECVDFDDSESYSTKIETIKESFFDDSQIGLNENTLNEINNTNEKSKPIVNGYMGLYSQALDRVRH